MPRSTRPRRGPHRARCVSWPGGRRSGHRGNPVHRVRGADAERDRGGGRSHHTLGHHLGRQHHAVQRAGRADLVKGRQHGPGRRSTLDLPPIYATGEAGPDGHGRRPQSGEQQALLHVHGRGQHQRHAQGRRGVEVAAGLTDSGADQGEGADHRHSAEVRRAAHRLPDAVPPATATSGRHRRRRDRHRSPGPSLSRRQGAADPQRRAHLDVQSPSTPAAGTRATSGPMGTATSRA